MSNVSADLEAISAAARRGDPVARMQLLDLAQDAPEPPQRPGRWRPREGDMVVVYTGSFFHVGRCAGIDHEAVWLEEGHAMVLETGEFDDFYGHGTARYRQVVPTPVMIERGVITHMTPWPHPAIPSQTPRGVVVPPATTSAVGDGV